MTTLPLFMNLSLPMRGAYSSFRFVEMADPLSLSGAEPKVDFESCVISSSRTFPVWGLMPAKGRVPGSYSRMASCSEKP